MNKSTKIEILLTAFLFALFIMLLALSIAYVIRF